MRILADTNVWIDFFRTGDALLSEILEQDFLACHEVVIGELASGNLPDRKQTIKDLQLLHCVPNSAFEETLGFIEARRLFGLGLQWNDLVILSSALAEGELLLWTRDRRLAEVAADMGIGFAET